MSNRSRRMLQDFHLGSLGDIFKLSHWFFKLFYLSIVHQEFMNRLVFFRLAYFFYPREYYLLNVKREFPFGNSLFFIIKNTILL